MIALLAAGLIALQDTTHGSVPPAAGAFADTGTANLVARAREHRDRAERRVLSYEAFVRQRVGVGMRALRRDRMIFAQGLAAHIIWRRDTTSTIQMIGAREAIPIAMPGLHVPLGLLDYAGDLAFDPSQDNLRLLGQDPEGILYPLAPGAERYYTYASGDTTRITLPTGRQITLIEVRVVARQPSFHLVTGSLWLDADSWGLVRMVVRPSRPYDYRVDKDSGDDNVPSVINPGVDIRYITVEYGLYDSQWWLPRFYAVDGVATLGSLARVPARFERTYTITNVVGGPPPPAGAPLRWRAGARLNVDSLFHLDSAALDSARYAAIAGACRATYDSLVAARREARRHRKGATVDVEVDEGPHHCLRRHVLAAAGHPSKPDVDIVMPADTMALLDAPQLGPPILDMGDVISERDLSDLSQAIGALPGVPWMLRGSAHLDLARYNRVEALSVGVRGRLDFGKLRADASLRLGVADLVPNGELALTRPAQGMDLTLSAYRALNSVDPPTRALGVGNSVEALLFGRDDGDYFRTLGVALAGRPGVGHGDWFDWRVFAEQQRAASKETDFSFAHAFDDSRLFRPNIVAAPLDQAGVRASLRGFHSYTTGRGVGAELLVDGQTGDATFGKAALTLRGTSPVAGLIVGAEAGAGSSTGPVPVQGLWYVGGPATLRGYSGGVMSGPAFWRGRVEVANNFPAARVALFSDAGWAGARSAFGTGRALVSVGIGVSFLDGLMRVDLSRGLRAPRGTRLDLYADGLL